MVSGSASIWGHSIGGGGYAPVGVTHPKPKQRQDHNRGRFRACHWQAAVGKLEAWTKDNLMEGGDCNKDQQQMIHHTKEHSKIRHCNDCLKRLRVDDYVDVVMAFVVVITHVTLPSR